MLLWIITQYTIVAVRQIKPMGKVLHQRRDGKRTSTLERYYKEKE